MGTIAPGGSGLGTISVGASALALVLAAIVFVANFAYSAFLDRREDNARALAAELQVGSQQLAKFAQQAVGGNEEAFDDLGHVRRRMDAIVQGLGQGSVAMGVPAYGDNPLEPGVASALGNVAGIWSKVRADAERIEANREQVLATAETATSFNIRIPQISAQLAEVVRGMSGAGAHASQINLANRQIVLADRLSRRVTEILAGGDTAVVAADALQRDTAVFDQVLQGLRDGAPESGISQVTDPAALAALERATQLFGDSRREVDVILEASTDLVEVQISAEAIVADSDVLLEASMELFHAIGSPLKRVFPNDLIALVAGLIGAIAVVSLLASVWQMQRQVLRRP